MTIDIDVSSPSAAWQPAERDAKRRRVDRYAVGAFLLVTLAAAIRIALIASGWPHLNADEGTMGIMARHIAYQGEHPIFFYGQAYMGTIEAYLGALAFRLLGASSFALRLGPIVLFCAFLSVLYLLAQQLYGRRVALLSLGLLSLGSDVMLFHQVQAIGGYTETLFFAILLLALASWLSLSEQGPRPAVFFGWGLAAGLGMWSDLLIVPFVVTSGGLLLAFCRQELRSRRGLLLLAGLVIGASPLIVFELGAAGSHDIISTFLASYRAGHGAGTHSLLQSAAGTLLVSLPIMTGGNAICPLSPEAAWPLGPHSGTEVVRCTIIHGAWGSSVGLLYLLAALLTIRVWWSARPCPATGTEMAAVRRPRVLSSVRLALVGSAGLTVLLYTLSPAAAQSPWMNARYLVGIWPALPAILAPLARATGSSPFHIAGRPSAAGIVALAILFSTAGAGTAETFSQVPATQQFDRWQEGFIHQMVRRHITHIYTDYWTCDRVAFQSDERLICSVLDGRLQPGLNRYARYEALVRDDQSAAYAFPDGSTQARALARRMERGRGFRRSLVNGYAVYQPMSTIR